MPIHIWWDMLLDNGVAVAWQLDFREINHWICEGVCLCYYGYQWQYHAIIRSLSGPIGPGIGTVFDIMFVIAYIYAFASNQFYIR